MRVFRSVFLLSFYLCGFSSGADTPQQPFVMPHGWGAFFKDEKGIQKNLVQPIEKNSDKDWMFLQFTDYTGLKNRLAVMQVENKTAAVEQAENTKNTVVVTNKVAEVPVGAVEEMLMTALINTHRYILVERKALENTLAEQDLGASGRVTQASASKVGRMLGAQHLIFVSVNEWSPNKSKTGGALGAIGGGFLGGFGAKKKEAEVAMSFRIVDATTGEVLQSTTERAKTTSWGFGFGGGGGGGGGLIGYEKDAPINYAVMSCINKAVYKIAMTLKDSAWSGSVIVVKPTPAVEPAPLPTPPPAPVVSKSKKSSMKSPVTPPPPPPPPPKIYINAGNNTGITPGMRLKVISLGEEIIDPSTGTVLDRERKDIGVIEVTETQEKISIVKIVDGCIGIKNGDAVTLLQPQTQKSE